MIDLQIHTTDSDGTWPWTKAVETCVELGLTAFSITDHDTIARVDEVRAWGQKHGKKAIPGIEVSASENGETVHLLGYFLEGDLTALENKLAFLRRERLIRNKKIIKKLNELGLDITEEQVQKIAGTGTMGRPHIARALLQKGYVKDIKDAFNRYLAYEGAAYYPKVELPLQEAVDLLHGAGAVTSIAHPLLLKRSRPDLETSARHWAAMGVDALEAYYPLYTDSQEKFVRKLARDNHMLVTGGSDFHGDNKPHIKIGTGTGKLSVPDEILEPLEKRRDDIVKNLDRKASV